MCPIRIINFEYVIPEQDDSLTDNEKLKLSLEEIEKWSNIIGANYLPKYDDPTKSKEIKNFTEKILKNYSLKSRIYRFFTREKAPSINTEILRQGSSVAIDKSTSPKEWRNSLLNAILDTSQEYVRLCVWSSEWNTFYCHLNLWQSSNGIKLEGQLSSFEAFDNKILQSKMSKNLVLLFENSNFKSQIESNKLLNIDS